MNAFIMTARASSLTSIAALAKEIIVFRSDSKCTVLEKKRLQATIDHCIF
jgi:hypothetical protein